MKTSLFIFTRDLRIQDHPLLNTALEKSDAIYFLFCMDPLITTSPYCYELPKKGTFNDQFLRESLEDLNKQLNTIDHSLNVTTKNLITKLEELHKTHQFNNVYMSQYTTTEEIENTDQVEQFCQNNGINFLCEDTNLLFSLNKYDQLFAKTPYSFTAFRKKIEKHGETFLPPILLKNHTTQSLNTNFKLPIKKNPPALMFNGGSKTGKNHLNDYIWESKAIKHYKFTRNQLLGKDYSSKFSPWLAHGCISPREIMAEVSKFEKEIGSSISTYWIWFELLWRDYFHILAHKLGPYFFDQKKDALSIYMNTLSEIDQKNATKYINAETDSPFINAGIKELKETGYISNRIRQNMASYWIHDLNLPWYAGAALFESFLIDFDPASNTGNWGYIAGKGAFKNKERRFNIISQEERYDPKHEYSKHWQTR